MKISKTLRWQILGRDGNKCKMCGTTNCLEIDHIIPRSKGGPTIPSNLQVLCSSCNKRKGNSIPEELIKKQRKKADAVKKESQQFNIRINSDLLEEFKKQACIRGNALGIDHHSAINRAVHQAFRWYVEQLPE